MKADPPLVLAFAVPDHPWGDGSATSINNAKVRIAMTVGTIEDTPGLLSEVILDRPGEERDGFRLVNYDSRVGRINSNLTIGADVGGVKALKSNSLISGLGMSPSGKGFIVTPSEAESLGLGTIPGLERHIRPYRNGRDIAAKSREVMIIDLFGLTIDEVKKRYPAVYQHIVDNVKPERDKNRREHRRTNWWLFGDTNENLRNALNGLPRYIATPQTAQRRYFVFLERDIIPDAKLINVASDDAYILGVLSSRIHQEWVLATGGKLGAGNDPVYVKSVCFDAFPFPEPTKEQQERIRNIAEMIDVHRKKRQAENQTLTLTDMYAVLEDMRYGVNLTAKKEKISQQGNLPTLYRLHQELDSAVAEAYGWPINLLTDEILTHLVELNIKRESEEKSGEVKWLRPEYQNSK